MAPDNKEKNKTVDLRTDIDGGNIDDHLNSDNLYSDRGLENARLLRKATKDKH